VADARVWHLEGEVKFQRAGFLPENPARVAVVAYLGTVVGPAMVAAGASRAEAPLDDEARPLLHPDPRFRTYQAALGKADETRRQLVGLERAQRPEVEAIARERAALQADMALSGAEMGERLARLDTRQAALRQAAAGLQAGLEILDARVAAALPDAQRALREARRAIRQQRQENELALRRYGRGVLEEERYQEALSLLGSVQAAEEILASDSVRFVGEEDLLPRMAREDTPAAAPAGAAEPAAAAR
jgi:hypothetical protein